MQKQINWKVCIHWSAGRYRNLEKSHYHYTMGKNCVLNHGNLPPEANIPKNGITLAGQPANTYIAHCGGGNSFCIGFAWLGMSKNNGKWVDPITKEMFEAGCKELAQICKDHNAPITRERVFTHYEFGKDNPNTPSAGKIDITYLPFKPELKPDQIGDYIRTKVKWYYSRLK